jgi:hypothetical protein
MVSLGPWDFPRTNFIVTFYRNCDCGWRWKCGHDFNVWNSGSTKCWGGFLVSSFFWIHDSKWPSAGPGSITHAACKFLVQTTSGISKWPSAQSHYMFHSNLLHRLPTCRSVSSCEAFIMRNFISCVWLSSQSILHFPYFHSRTRYR